MILLSAMPPPTTVPISHALGTGGGRDWFDWTQYLGVQIAALGAVVVVVLTGILIWRSRPEYVIGPAVFVRGSDTRVTYSIDVHIVASGHWVIKQLKVRFIADGLPIEPIRRDPTSDRGVGELIGKFVYEMDRQIAPIEVDALLKLKHGKVEKYHGILEPR